MRRMLTKAQIEALAGRGRLDPATAETLGGIKAKPATEFDTVSVNIGTDNKLYTTPTYTNPVGMSLIGFKPTEEHKTVQIVFPGPGTGSLTPIYINWGDGTIVSKNITNEERFQSHTYTAPFKDIVVSFDATNVEQINDFYNISYLSLNNNTKITNTSYLGLNNSENSLIQIDSLEAENAPGLGLFSNFQNLKKIGLLKLKTDGESLSNIFSDNKNLVEAPIMNTKGCTSVKSMFNCCINLISVPTYNFSSVTDFTGLFEQCYNLTVAPFLDTSAGTNFEKMF